jgi:hypothetical protein
MSSGVSTDVTLASAKAMPCSTAIWRSIESLTAAASSGSPSENVTPSRILKV